MKIKMTKYGKHTIKIWKETTKQSIVEDLFTMLVFVVAIGANALFSIYVARSIVMDIFIVFLILVYFIGRSKRQQHLTKEEAEKEIKEFLNNKQ